jgi:hypothetical protein
MTVAIATSKIVQTAFRHMGLRPPSSFADDSDQAIAAAEQYDEALCVCLEAIDWGFCSTTASLAPIESEIPPDEVLPYGFALPGDCLILREVLTEDLAWRRDKEVLRADVEGPIVIRYSAKITDEEKLPATFRQAVALQLAVILAPTFVEQQGKIDRLQQQLGEAIRVASRTDARTASPLPWHEGSSGTDWASEATL